MKRCEKATKKRANWINKMLDLSAINLDSDDNTSLDHDHEATPKDSNVCSPIAASSARLARLGIFTSDKHRKAQTASSPEEEPNTVWLNSVKTSIDWGGD